MHEWGELSGCSCQSLVVHSCGLLDYLNSFHRGTFKFKAKFGVDWLLYSLRHFECNGHTCSLNSVYHPTD